MDELVIKKLVRDGYGRIAQGGDRCCLPMASCCADSGRAEELAKRIGYTDQELRAVPEGANLGLGCGNPVALSSLKQGETVLDLGSGAGFDCLLAARQVGPHGRVIGVDMTPEMVEKARQNAEAGGFGNVEFRLGEIEELPVPDDFVDAIVSNCVINLAPDKGRVFQEAFRVLKPGGRIMVSDIVLKRDLPHGIKNSAEAYLGCVAGAISREDYLEAMRRAGFRDISVLEETRFPMHVLAHDPSVKAMVQDSGVPEEEWEMLADSAVSIKVRADKPLGR
ncbi:MAG: arsenite methyltransferase [Thermodesulfobacteriota bacterium]